MPLTGTPPIAQDLYKDFETLDAAQKVGCDAWPRARGAKRRAAAAARA